MLLRLALLLQSLFWLRPVELAARALVAAHYAHLSRVQRRRLKRYLTTGEPRTIQFRKRPLFGRIRWRQLRHRWAYARAQYQAAAALRAARERYAFAEGLSAMATGTSAMPQAQDVFTNQTDGVSTDSAANINRLQDAVKALEAILVGPPSFNVKGYGAAMDGTTDDTVPYTSALADAGSKGGTVKLPAGVLIITAQVVYGLTNVTVEGAGRGATEIRYTGSAASIVHKLNTGGITFSRLTLTYSNVGFTGTLVDFASQNDVLFDDAKVNGGGGGSGANGAAALVSYDGAYDCTFRRTWFQAAQRGARGQTNAASATNANVFDNCYFQNNVLANISNPGGACTLLGCVFEPLTNGKAGAVVLDSTAFKTTGMSVRGCWAGDVTVTGGDQFQINGGGCSLSGNPGISGIAAATTNGIHVIGASPGLTVTGNEFSFLTWAVTADTGVNLAGFIFEGNDTTNNVTGNCNLVGTNVPGTAIAVRIGPATDASGYKDFPFMTSAAAGGTGIGLENTSASGRRWAIYSSGASNAIGSGWLAFIDDSAGANRMAIGPTGGVIIGSPTGGDKGAGTLNVATGVYLNGTAYTNPHGGFEAAYRGAVEQFAERMAAMGLPEYRHWSLEELEAYTREHFHFPYFADEEGNDLFAAGERHLLMTEVLAVHLFAIHHRLERIESARN